LLGEGSNGTAGANTTSLFATPGGGGSSGTAGSASGPGGVYGGGAAASGSYRESDGTETFTTGDTGGQGAVRIIYPGGTRSFPSTNTGDL
jgi:hypothetical protein